MESILDRIASALGVCARRLRTANMYRPEGDCTPFGQALIKCNARRFTGACGQ
jgi:xanthine dehydrogenase molybdopterin-binding subunit B